MAIATAQVTINGTTYNMTYDSSSGKYVATILAPNASSYNQTDHVYNTSITATNTAGTSASVNKSDYSSLGLRVYERVAPTVSAISPATGSSVITNSPTVTFTVTDSDSGIDISTLDIKVDGTSVSTGITTSAMTGGYSVTLTGLTLTDGSHTIVASVSDHDGNSDSESTTFTVDTVAPTLNVTSPSTGTVTAISTVHVIGTTNDTTSSPVTVTIAVNGTTQATVTPQSGSFDETITLSVGSNAIVITATDTAGKTTTQTVNVTYDNSVPEITNVTVSPNPADAGATVTISATIVG